MNSTDIDTLLLAAKEERDLAFTAGRDHLVQARICRQRVAEADSMIDELLDARARGAGR